MPLNIWASKLGFRMYWLIPFTFSTLSIVGLCFHLFCSYPFSLDCFTLPFYWIAQGWWKKVTKGNQISREVTDSEAQWWVCTFSQNPNGEMTAPISKYKFPGNQPQRSNSYTGGQDYHSEELWQAGRIGQQECHEAHERKTNSPAQRMESNVKVQHLPRKDLGVWRTQSYDLAVHSCGDNGQPLTSLHQQESW